jgi:predicted phage terminase large subunit-like protein
VQKLLEGPEKHADWKQNLLVNVPPGTMKSLIVSVFAPVWQWIHRPGWKAVFISANPRVTVRDSLKRRDLIKSEWFRQTFRPEWSLSDDQDAKTLFKNTRGGFMQALGIGGKITGDRVDGIFVDDPLDAKEAPAKAARAAVITAWTSAIRNRLTSMIRGTRCVIMQRLHEEDLSGYILENEPEKWEHVCFPMEFEPDHDHVDRRDPRKTEGELLFAVRFPEGVLDEEKTNLGSAGYAGQHQQRPAPASGNKFQRTWWRFYRKQTGPGDNDTTPRKRPKGCNELPTVVLPYDHKFPENIQSWDMAFKDTDGSDYVVGAVVAREGARKFVRDIDRAKRDMPVTVKALKLLSARYPETHMKLVEDKANGPAVISTLETEVTGLIAVNPEGGKEVRAAAMQPGVEAGNWFLPEGADWVDDFIDEFANFPFGKNDDQVDAISQAAIRFQQSEGDESLYQW